MQEKLQLRRRVAVNYFLRSICDKTKISRLFAKLYKKKKKKKNGKENERKSFFLLFLLYRRRKVTRNLALDLPRMQRDSVESGGGSCDILAGPQIGLEDNRLGRVGG